jgi:hypothetical protein
MSGAFAALEPTLFDNGVATISHFSQTAADCYSVEQHRVKIGMAVFRQPVLYLSAKMLRVAKGL